MMGFARLRLQVPTASPASAMCHRDWRRLAGPQEGTAMLNFFQTDVLSGAKA
jgi:hypothetical protein